ncbi:EpsD family peptidyl-prolyl cis-trans isomerase [Niveibacterium sp. SC-1]|uniref:EpsD family peptidyl-prolyl cis-trans isomerase n=1 Tax=Niveibacterium sp. SC-1 TaxID=3135646 RepID=UPI00311D6989
MNRMLHSLRPVSLVFLCALPAACARHDAAPSGQVVAKVNGSELTVHQLNYAIQRSGGAGGEAGSRALLDRLVDQQLLVTAAEEKKLDRDPRVVLALDAARREVLARSYLEQMAATPASADSKAVRDYYQAHPELFAERSIYRFKQIVVPGQLTPAAKAATASAATLDGVAAALRKENVKFTESQQQRAAEQLPMEVLPRMHALKPGQLLTIPADDGVMYVELVDARVEPMDEVAARPLIERFLGNKERGDAARTELARLKAGAKVEYLGQFAKADSPVVPVSIEPTADRGDASVLKALK